MVLPLNDYWSQGSPYNDQCPNLWPGRDERTVVGCVATAMTQVMNYWQWPPTGVGTGSMDWTYRWRSDWISEPLAVDPGVRLDDRLDWSDGDLRMSGYWDGSIYWGLRYDHEDNQLFLDALETLWNQMTEEVETHSADFGATTYNWSILKPSHTDPVDAGDMEVAKLAYHVGISVEMRWGIWGSAPNVQVPSEAAMEDHWQYHPDCTYSVSDFDTIVDEIRWFRPVMVDGGKVDGGGHQFVACGYNLNAVPEPQLLFNMGWSGGSTSWYTLDEQFPVNQRIYSNVAPQDVVRFVEDDGLVGGNGAPANPYLGLPYALASVPNDTTLVFKAGTTHTLSGDPAVIDTPLILKGHDVTIARAGP
jgi:hypothetical protein